jgi:hypothetical protein
MASPSQHHADSERLIRTIPETPDTAGLLALAHAVLTLSPRRARRVEREARHGGTLPPHLSWGDES